MNTKLIAGLIIVAVLGGCLGYYFSDKLVIARLLNDLAWDVSKEEDESTMGTALKLKEVKNLLADDCRLIVPERSYEETVERDMVVQYLLYHRQQYGLITVTIEEMLITFPADGQAVVQCRVRLEKEMVQAEPEVVTAEVEFVLKKDTDWLLDGVTLPESMLE